MNLKMYGRFGWQWEYAGEIWRTGDDGRGLYCGRVLMDSEFTAPRGRVEMLRFLERGMK